MTITEILNIWNDVGMFSYVIPFLLIFAVVFAILRKTGLFSRGKSGDGKDVDGFMVEALIAVSVALLALQMDIVSEFFAVIFPRFGVGLSVFLVIVILIGFFWHPVDGSTERNKTGWIGWVVGIGVVLWAFSEWDNWYGYSGFGGWFSEYIWALIVLGGLIAIIIVMGRNKD